MKNDPALRTLGTGILESVKTVFLDRIAALPWRTPVSRAEATAKINAVDVQMGFPRRWTDDSGLELSGDTNLTDVIAAEGFAVNARLALAATSAGPAEGASGIGTLTRDQLFFIASGQAVCQKAREPQDPFLSSRTWLPSAPPKFRVNGPLSDSPDFAAAFHCPTGAPMAPARQCQVW